jgi:hypothetical protein
MSVQESIMFPGRETSKEKFVWRATYEDGKTLDQFEGKKANQCCDIVRAGLRSFEFIEENKTLLKINLQIGDKFSFRRRTMVKTGEGMLARFYAVSVTYSDIVTYFWLDEETKVVEVTRLKVGETQTGLFYAFSPVENDDITIS